MIEVFKTNVQNRKQANKLLKILSNKYPEAKINFDIDDCDKVLRVDANTIAVKEIIVCLNQVGFKCEELQ